MKQEFVKTFKEALTKRLFPFTSLRPDDLAYAIGVNGYTLRCWLRGENCANGAMVAACVGFFARQGDFAILQELFPDTTPLVQRRKEDEAALQLVSGLRTLLNQGVVAA